MEKEAGFGFFGAGLLENGDGESVARDGLLGPLISNALLMSESVAGDGEMGHHNGDGRADWSVERAEGREKER